ncbi:DUF2490 domain-containing protein [Winogradskyella haliclonae]|uniref:DUF2490 domain-containing protein n=1 Tax=Winogradskyella haliclonae TaxID=2048558 RepID=A0ABQ2BU65_9FLAO|nr:DUF2490 domain-containing protein [Winogradskyella haliclonae]GGI56014.1 hypothetical protein GCM10011444_03230 [Winogradskyella haliclonae]
MYYIRILIISFSFIFGLNLFSQNNFETLGETGFALNHKVSDSYKINFSARSRYYLYQDQSFDFENRQVDIAHFSTLNLDYNHSLSLGIQYRFRSSFDGGDNELRLTQQFNYTKKNQALRFGHRIRFEQRIFDQLTVLRSRYRFALDVPLNGEKLDIGESYLVASMEALLSKNVKIKPELDHRTTAQIGWLINETSKIQLGLEYRFEALNIKAEEKLFILTSFILKV